MSDARAGRWFGTAFGPVRLASRITACRVYFDTTRLSFDGRRTGESWKHLDDVWYWGDTEADVRVQRLACDTATAVVRSMKREAEEAMKITLEALLREMLLANAREKDPVMKAKLAEITEETGVDVSNYSRGIRSVNVNLRARIPQDLDLAEVEIREAS